MNSGYYRSTVVHQKNGQWDLKRSSSHLRYPLDQKLLGNNSYAYVGITCQQLTIVGEPQNNTKIIRVVTEEELMNNKKFFDIFGSTSSVYRGSLTTIITAMVLVYK